MTELPLGWLEVPLQDAINVSADRASPANLGRMRFIGLEHVESYTGQLSATSETSTVKSQVVLFEKGDTLFGRLRPYLRKIVSVDFSGAASAEFIVFRQSGAIDNRYLGYLLRSDDVIAFANRNSTGDRPRISADALGEYRLWLPPLAEQKRIVAKVGSLLARITGAREELARIPVLVAKAKAALLRYTSETSDHSEFFHSEHWETRTVADVCKTTFDGPFGSNLKSKDYVETGVRVVRLENIGSLRFIAEKETFIDEEKFLSLKRHELKEYDVLFSSFLADSVRVCLLPNDLPTKSINKADCFCLRVDQSTCSPNFLAYRLASPETYDTLVQGVHGATRPRISLSQLKRFSFGLPPLHIQGKIVEMLDTAFDHLDKVVAQYRSAVSLLDHMEQQILASAFRGKLVPQDPNDEPASALLERLKAELDNDPSARTMHALDAETAAARAVSPRARKPRTPRTVAMPKTRTDEDVWHQPYLAELLRLVVLIDEVDLSVELGIEDTPRVPEAVAQTLFKKSDLGIADFYKQLSWEIGAGHILEESDGRLRAA